MGDHFQKVPPFGGCPDSSWGPREFHNSFLGDSQGLGQVIQGWDLIPLPLIFFKGFRAGGIFNSFPGGFGEFGFVNLGVLGTWRPNLGPNRG